MTFRSFIAWLIVFITCAVYLGVILLVLWIPCQGELLIGSCTLGKTIIFAIDIFLLVIYLLLLFTFSIRKAAQPSLWGRNIGPFTLISLIFISIPLIFLFFVLRKDPHLQPYNIEQVRLNGRQISFVSFSDRPVAPSHSENKLAFVASGVITVEEDGSYIVHPMSFKDKPARVLSLEDMKPAQNIYRYLRAWESYQFDYYVEVIEGESNKTCAPSTWKVLWTVQTATPFPLYLFGQGGFAQVYPDDSGDYAFVTHINSDFQTGEYTVCYP